MANRELTTRVDSWGVAFLGALGLAACGGSTEGGDGSASRGGTAGSGGSSQGGSAQGGSSQGGSSQGGSSQGGSSQGGSSQGGSSQGGSSQGGSSQGGSAGAPNPFPCNNPEPVEVGGRDTGYVRCEGGFTHRVEAKDCPAVADDFVCPEDPQYSTCETHADCTDQAHGRCGVDLWGAAACSCSYGCVTDADCGTSQICLCGANGGTCVYSTCVADDDCAGDLMCTSYVQDPGCGGTAFACQTPNDECGGSEDCGNSTGEQEECSLDQNGAHVCQQAGCAIGRPFLVSGEERVAPLVCRSDWGIDLKPDVTGLDQFTRARLAAHWTRAAQMEHGAVAAFARFSLQLMSFGAPAELIEETNQAMVDETAHARVCFALASGYAGRDIGPGPLDVSDAFERPDLLEAVRLVIREGCMGETVATLESKEALTLTRDDAVRKVLERVISDETRHAALAWKFVRWALKQDERVAEVLEAELRAPVTAQILDDGGFEASEPTQLSDHGMLDLATKNEVRRQVIQHVIFPGLRGILAERMPAASA